MEVRPGYKQTEVGSIPEEWEVLPLAALGTFSKGQSIRKSETATGDLPCVRYGEIYTHHHDVVRGYYSHISRTVARTSKRLSKGDILFAGSGETKEEIGKAVAFVDDREAYAGGDIVILSPRSASSEYLGYLLNSPRVARQKASRGQGDAVVHISASALGAVVIPVPPVYEQRAIAAALGDVDALLDGLDRLIAKKRDLKQAAIQQFLTGQTRLPGFHGEWQVKRLGDIAAMGSGGTPQSSVAAYYGGGIPWVSISDMTKAGKVIERTERSLTALGLSSSAAQMFPAGTVLYAMYASLGECSIAGIPVCTSQAILGIRPRPGLDGEFLYYFLASLKQLVRGLGQQGTQANLNKGMVQAFLVALPSLPEQVAISSVLSDMDAELAALEARRGKARVLKQAMMQELVTGRVRLV